MKRTLTPPPCEFGAPEKFHEWREGQDNIFWDILDCKKRFSIHNAPVGSGKSPSYMTAALAEGKRVAILTESKGLQDQIHRDFGGVGLFDMRGLSNYPCQALEKGGHLEFMWSKKWGPPTCKVGPCTAGMRCDLKDLGCHYFDAYRKAKTAKIVSTNYAYWIAINRFGEGLGKFDWLILDECHSADSQLSSALSVEFTPKELKHLGSIPPKLGSPLLNWRMWSRVQHLKIQGKIEEFHHLAKSGHRVDERGMVFLINETDIPDAAEVKLWRDLEVKCRSAAESTDDWIVEYDEHTGNIRLAPAWVRSYAEPFLFTGIPRIIMMSATVREKTAELLGIRDNTYEFKEYPSYFPVDRRPIYWLPTVKLNHRTGYDELRTWVVRIDQILRRRMDRKGIIHTVSYERQKFLLEHSRFRDVMYANVPGNTRDVVKAFREAKSPAVLVSPSVGTGFDFPYEAARYQIIGKVPFKDARGAVLKTQAEDDPDYLSYLVAQDLTQMYGRPNRAADDYSETWIVDDQIERFIDRYGRFFPAYFLEAFQRVDSVMDPPSLEAL